MSSVTSRHEFTPLTTWDPGPAPLPLSGLEKALVVLIVALFVGFIIAGFHLLAIAGGGAW